MFGLVERALNRATAHIWFERSKASERAHVAQRYVCFCQPLYVHDTLSFKFVLSASYTVHMTF